MLGPFNVNDPFDEGAKEFTSDPRCQYDKATKRWFATILFLNSSFTAGRVDIAVSQTSDPTGLWNNYSIDTTKGFKGDTCPCFGDQPRLGIDPFNIYISTDEFSILGPGFFGSQPVRGVEVGPRQRRSDGALRPLRRPQRRRFGGLRNPAGDHERHPVG